MKKSRADSLFLEKKKKCLVYDQVMEPDCLKLKQPPRPIHVQYITGRTLSLPLFFIVAFSP